MKSEALIRYEEAKATLENRLESIRKALTPEIPKEALDVLRIPALHPMSQQGGPQEVSAHQAAKFIAILVAHGVVRLREGIPL